ncbi:MAG: CHASE domain-containing protein [Candidatus Marinimicrobia bacterium]|nr:CHASE domain-containing protein [Candidatus Neomarinimicrobiota bacterium]
MKRKDIILPWLLLITALLITIFSSLSFKLDADYIAEKEFESTGKVISERITSHLRTYAQLLRSGAAFFSGSDLVTREQWKTYVDQTKVFENFPGIQGFGFSLSMQKNHLARHIQKISSEGFPDYKVWPEGERDTYSAIIFLEPFSDRNLRAFGYDMFSEPMRREAMERARDMDIAALTGKITLVQETGKDVQAGALMYVPLYRKGAQILTIEQRRNALIGWVYSPYRMGDLISGIVDIRELKKDKLFNLDIYDGSQISPESLLFEYNFHEHLDRPAQIRFSQTMHVDFNDRLWTIILARENGNSFSEYTNAWIALFSGVIISILIFYLAKSQINIRYNTQRIAERVTLKLEESTESLNVIAKSTGDVLYRLQYDTMQYDYLSPAFTSLTGYSMQEINDLGFNNIVEQVKYPGQPKLAVKDQNKSRKEGQTGQWSGEFKIRTKAGETKWIYDQSYPWKDNSGNIIGSVGVMQDRTDLKQAENELTQIHKRLTNTLEDMTDGFVSLDENWIYTYVNKKAGEMFGRKPTDLVGKHIWTEFPDAVDQPFYKRYYKAFETQRIVIFEDYYQPWDRWFENRVIPSMDGLAIFFQDITERIQAKEELEDSTHKLEEAQRIAHIGSWALDITNNQLTWSDEIYRMFGLEPQEFKATYESFLENIHPDDRELVNIAYTESLESKTPYDIAHRLQLKDGTIKWVRENCETIYSDDGVAIRSTGTVQDITARKLAEDAREKALIEAKAANQVKDQFIANISHEIRTPLNNLVGFADHLKHRYNDLIEEADMNIFGFMENSSNRLMSTVDSILNMSQLEAGSLNLRPEKLDLNALATSVVQGLKGSADNKNLELLYEAPQEKIWVFADEYSIHQALINLTDNAIKYTTKGTVELKLGSTNEQVILSVIDTGIGISDEYQAQIFEPYTQESEGYTKQFQGVGLGLALVKKYLEASDVELELVSKKDVGSTFTLTFLRYEESASV